MTDPFDRPNKPQPQLGGIEEPKQEPFAAKTKPNQPLPKAALTRKNFLSRAVAWPLNDEPGYISLHWYRPNPPDSPKAKFDGRWFRSIDEFCDDAGELAEMKQWNLFFCLSRQAKNGVRKAEGARAFKAIWLDIDIKADGYTTKEEATEALFNFIEHFHLPVPSAIVMSGNGLHVYWISDRALTTAEWRPYAEGLKAAALQWKLKCDAGLTTDAARVLRVPGSLNFKTDPPHPVQLLHLMATDIDFAADLSGLPELSPPPRKTNGKTGTLGPVPEAFKHLEVKSLGAGIEGSPRLDFETIKAGCGWLQEGFETGGKEYDQPQWNLAALGMTFFENGKELLHQLSNQHPDYNKYGEGVETEELWARKVREQREKDLGYPSCRAIQDAKSKHCKSCKHFAAEGSPLHLGLGQQRAENLDERPDNDLPDLVISHEPTAVAKELAKLIAQGDHYFFNGHAPVRIAIEIDDMPRAIEVTTENVRVLAHEICNPVKYTKQGAVLPAEVRADVANIYLKGLEGRWGLKRFAGIATTPILSGDGAIHSMDGYDPATGLWCHNIPTLDIPENPRLQEAKAALKRIRLVFRTFPFADAARVQDLELGAEVVDPDKPIGLDESSFLVALLTAACRPSLKTAPGFLCDAPALSGAGTGKGLLVKAICVIASGASPHAFTSGHDADEFDKRLTAALVQANPAIFLDNFNAKELSSDILASVLTENPAQVRIMGQTRMVPLHVCTFIGITGNGVEIAEDMARRLLSTRLDARMENPEMREFRPGFLDDILRMRCSLLSDLLMIWRWGRQNSDVPAAGRPLGSYETWAQWVRDPLLALGLRDPVERIAETKANDPKRRALVELFDLWHRKHKGEPVMAAQLDPEIIQLIDLRAYRKDGGFQYSRQKVASFLTQRAGTHVGGYVLTQDWYGPESKKIASYTLTRTTPEPTPEPGRTKDELKVIKAEAEARLGARARAMFEAMEAEAEAQAKAEALLEATETDAEIEARAEALLVAKLEHLKNTNSNTATGDLFAGQKHFKGIDLDPTD